MDSEPKKRIECRYSQRQCSKPVIDGYQLCKTHILDDKDCPFQQCIYVSSKTGRRCVQATLNPQKKDGHCLQHTSKLNRARCASAKKQQALNPISVKSLTRDLAKYTDAIHAAGEVSDVPLDTIQSQLAELASSDDSDIEERNYPSASYLWQPDSDSESIDSENEDIFKYAEIFTVEEVTRITRDKLIRLQSLYIEQFKWLQNVLRERRREYLSSKTSSDESKNTDVEQTQHDDVQCNQTVREYEAARRYHRRYGREALMYMRSQERRRAVCNPSTTDGHNHNRYRHASRHGTKYCSARNLKCHERSLPFTRYCMNHVESDSKQILFRRCGYEAVPGGLCCERVVVDINENARCSYHTNISGSQAAELEDSYYSDTEMTNTETTDDVIIVNVSANSSPSPPHSKQGDLNGCYISQSTDPVTIDDPIIHTAEMDEDVDHNETVAAIPMNDEEEEL